MSEGNNELEVKEKINEKQKEEKKEKQNKTSTEPKKEKKKSKKGLIIALVIIILVLIGASVGGYFLYNKIQLEKPLETAWGQTYYTYLKSITENEDGQELQEFNNSSYTKIEFCDLETEEYPVMVISYEQEDENYTNIYYIENIENNSVHMMSYSLPTDYEMLYSIEEKEYNWYIITKSDNTTEYSPFQNELVPSTGEKIDEEILSNEYTIKNDDKTTVETVDGEELSIDKFDETFIKPEIEDNSFEFDFNLSENDFKEAIENNVNEYKNQEQLITEEIKQTVTDKEAEITNKQEEMETAKEEVKKKEAEEEAKRKAEEEAEKGFKVGSHRLQYGTYESDVGIMDSSMYGTIILNSDGTCHIKANCEGDYPYEELDCDGTYKATRAIDYHDYYDAIEFTTDTGVTFTFEVSSDNAFSDQWHGYTYTGN